MKANYTTNVYYCGTPSVLADDVDGRGRAAGSTGGAPLLGASAVGVALDLASVAWTPLLPRVISLSAWRVAFTHCAVVASAIAVVTGTKPSPSSWSWSVAHHDHDVSTKNGATHRPPR
jgi:hypothetical protein